MQDTIHKVSRTSMKLIKDYLDAKYDWLNRTDKEGVRKKATDNFSRLCELRDTADNTGSGLEEYRALLDVLFLAFVNIHNLTSGDITKSVLSGNGPVREAYCIAERHISITKFNQNSCPQPEGPKFNKAEHEAKMSM